VGLWVVGKRTLTKGDEMKRRLVRARNRETTGGEVLFWSVILTLQIIGFVVSQFKVDPRRESESWAAHKWSLVEVCGHTVRGPWRLLQFIQHSNLWVLHSNFLPLWFLVHHFFNPYHSLPKTQAEVPARSVHLLHATIVRLHKRIPRSHLILSKQTYSDFCDSIQWDVVFESRAVVGTYIHVPTASKTWVLACLLFRFIPRQKASQCRHAAPDNVLLPSLR
jgi:hypothetical protein